MLSGEAGHSLSTHIIGKVFSSNLILPLHTKLHVWPHVLLPVSTKDVEALGHCSFSVSSTVENPSYSRLVFSCGVDCLYFLLWGLNVLCFEELFLATVFCDNLD